MVECFTEIEVEALELGDASVSTGKVLFALQRNKYASVKLDVTLGQIKRVVEVKNLKQVKV